MKPMTKRTFGMIALVSMVMVLPVMLYAAELIPFQPHTPIKADEVNQNFVELESRIAPYEDAISVDDLGNVGIGVTTPSQALDVNGKVKATSFVGNGSELTGISGLSQWSNVSGGISYGSGNVGIGTTSPGARLHISDSDTVGAYMDPLELGNGGATYGYRLRHFGGSTASTDRLELADHGNTTLMTWRPDGNVGIGTTAPSSSVGYGGPLLHLLGSQPALIMQNTSGAAAKWEIGTNWFGDQSSPPTLTFGVKPTYAMAIQSNGDVGIGTTEPEYLLDIAGDVRIKTGHTLRFGTGDTLITDTGTNSSLSLVTSNIDRVVVTQSGNVGIGTTNPTRGLEVLGGIKASGAFGLYSSTLYDANGGSSLTIGGGGGNIVTKTANGYLAFQTGTGSAAVEAMRVSSAGNVGIGTTSPAYKLEVNGTIHASGGVSVVGAIISDDYLYNSDARLKTDVLPLEHASEGIACLQGVTYRLTSPEASQEPQLGLIAQEVERCFPEVVSTGPDGFKSVSYARLVAPLIENAKEQQQALAAQQREIAWLKAEQAATSSRLARLEALLTPRR